MNLVYFWPEIKVYRQWVPCVCNSSYSFYGLFWNFADDLCMEWRCACGLGIILWLFFSHFFCFVNLVFYLAWHGIKVYRQCHSGYLVDATPLTVFHGLFWNFASVLCIEWRCACGLDTILWLFFFYLSNLQLLVCILVNFLAHLSQRITDELII